MGAQSLRKQDGIRWPYWPQERQQQSWDNMAPYAKSTVNGYGAAKFGGKSYNIRALANLYGMNRPLHICIFAREYDQLKDLHIEPIKAEMGSFIDAGKIKWNSNDKQFVYTETGSILKFIQINRPSDIHKHNGKGFDIIFVDEAQQFTPFELKFFPSLCRPSAIAMAAREKVRMHIKAAETEKEREFYSQRLEEIFYFPKALYCFNWGDAGHNYLVSRFWKGCDHRKKPGRDIYQFEHHKVTDEESGEEKIVWDESPDDFSFIFADWRDNVKGYQDNPEYIRSLKRLPEPYRTAYLEGDPYAFSGLKYQIVPPIHEVDMDKKLARWGGVVPDHWELIGALDPGQAAYCAFSLYAIDPSGNIYQLTDYYQKGFSFEENADNIFYNIKHCRWLPKDEVRLPAYVIAGRDAFARQSRYAIKAHEITLADIFWDKYGISLVECNTDRTLGAMAVASALQYRIDDNGNMTRTPKLFFGCYYESIGDKDHSGEYEKVSVCEPTIKELGQLKSDKHNPEDIERGENVQDHAFDKTKYMLLGANRPVERKSEKKELHPHSDYGRIPPGKVYQRDDSSERTINDTFASNNLNSTI